MLRSLLSVKDCEQNGLPFAVNTAFSKGGEGAVELAKVVVDAIDKNPSKPLQFLYDSDMTIKEKRRCYHQEYLQS